MKLTHTQGVVLAIGVGLVLFAIILLALAAYRMVPGLETWLALVPGAMGILLASLALLVGGGAR